MNQTNKLQLKALDFTVLNPVVIMQDENQYAVVRSLAHLANSVLYCNTGSIFMQMNIDELNQLKNIVEAAEGEVEDYLSGDKTLAQSKNLNSISIFCLLLCRLGGEVDIKTGSVQTGFKNVKNILFQELNYRETDKNKPDYVNISIFN